MHTYTSSHEAYIMITRYSMSLGSAACMTFGLLFLMQLLIATGQLTLRKSTGTRVSVALRPPIDDTPVVTDAEPEPPPPVQEQPVSPGLDPGIRQFGIGIPLPPPGTVPGPVINPGIPNGGLVELVSILPTYPKRLRDRGIEGYVLLQFTVSDSGAITDIVVIESTNAGFERAAIQALLKFKYKPQVIDGKPVAVTNLRKQFSFALEN
jgi:protein TonB